ncbi:unnamed protein product, partial [Urochloa humidicola]
ANLIPSSFRKRLHFLFLLDCNGATSTPRLACRNLPSFPRRSTLPNRMDLAARRRWWSLREAPQEWRSASSPDAPRAAPTCIRLLVIRHLLVEESLKHLLRAPPAAAPHLPLQLHLSQDCTNEQSNQALSPPARLLQMLIIRLHRLTLLEIHMKAKANN